MRNLIAMLFSLIFVSNLLYFVHGFEQVPCYFIFGDSLVDNGNNNNLRTKVKANYYPYGIDMPDGRPSGRFTNGKTTADIVGELLGFKEPIPTYDAAMKQQETIKGANYASASAGILPETGKHMGTNIDLLTQINNHKNIIAKMSRFVNNTNVAKDLLNKCLYYITIGNNDFINNYFLPQFYNSSKIYTPEKFADTVVNRYIDLLTTLHSLGARKIGVSGAMALGCTPFATNFYGTNNSICVDKMNNVANIYNNKLKDAVSQLSLELGDANVLFLGLADIPNTKLGGFQVTFESCCETKAADGLCIPNKEPCPDRKFQAFYDAFHPTEAINQISARSAHSAMFQILNST